MITLQHGSIYFYFYEIVWKHDIAIDFIALINICCSYNIKGCKMDRVSWELKVIFFVVLPQTYNNDDDGWMMMTRGHQCFKMGDFQGILLHKAKIEEL